MHKQVIYVVAMIAAMVAVDHASAQSYPWRSNDNGVVQSRVQSRLSNRLQRRAGSPAFVSFSSQEQEGGVSAVLADGQPSVSDVVTPDPVAAPQVPVPSTQEVAPQVQPQSVMQGAMTEPRMFQANPQSNVIGQWVSQEPGMSVQSNATDAPNYCDRDCRKPCCNIGCEWKLFGQSCRGLEMGGWVSSGYHNRSTGLFNNRTQDINVHQAWLYAQNLASRDGGWDIGYRTDLFYGIDAQDTQAFGNSPTGAPSGWDNGWDFGSYGWALPQAYVQFANQDWDVKVGKFFSPFGYERVGATENFFYSHSFTRVRTEPFTLTGVLGERRLDNTRSVLMGFTTGWDTGFENNSGGNLIVGLRRQVGEFVKMSFTASAGDTGFRDTGIFTTGVTEVQLTNSLRYVLQTDVANLRDNQEFGIVQYLFRDVNECLGLGARLEWWKSDRFYGGPTRSTYGFTMGANYRRNANLTIRPEVRWDWGAGAVDPGEAIIGVDAVMTF